MRYTNAVEANFVLYRVSRHVGDLKKFQAGGYRITKTEYQKFNISKKSNMFLKSLIYTDWKRFLIIMT